MARKKKKPDDINTNAWMDTYADTITLLLTFFILLYSFSTTDNERLQLIAAALKGEITGIPMKLENTPDISLEDIEQGIGEKSPYSILLDKIQEIIDKNAEIATGMKIKILLNNEQVEYEAVVTGDINGDGKISLVDLANLKLSMIGKRTLSTASMMAGDINGDGKTSLNDLAKLKMYLVGKITI